MTKQKYIMALDAGTTSNRCILFNARGAFGCRPGTDLTGRRVLLVDDIITTGATASACALALLQAGAVEVTAVAIATAEELPKSRKKPPETKP